MSSEEALARVAELNERLRSDPDLKAKMINGIKEAKSTPEAKARASEWSRSLWKERRPELIEGFKATAERDWSDPEKREARLTKFRATKARNKALKDQNTDDPKLSEPQGSP